MTWTYGDSESVYDWIKNNISILEAIGAIEIPDIQETDSYSGYANTCAIRAYKMCIRDRRNIPHRGAEGKRDGHRVLRRSP